MKIKFLSSLNEEIYLHLDTHQLLLRSKIEKARLEVSHVKVLVFVKLHYISVLAYIAQKTKFIQANRRRQQ